MPGGGVAPPRSRAGSGSSPPGRDFSPSLTFCRFRRHRNSSGSVAFSALEAAEDGGGLDTPIMGDERRRIASLYIFPTARQERRLPCWTLKRLRRDEGGPGCPASPGPASSQPRTTGVPSHPGACPDPPEPARGADRVVRPGGGCNRTGSARRRSRGRDRDASRRRTGSVPDRLACPR